MSDYQKETKFSDMGLIYIRDGKKFATLKLGSQSFIINLEDATKKFERLLASGVIDEAEAKKEISNLENKGAKYRMTLIADQ